MATAHWKSSESTAGQGAHPCGLPRSRLAPRSDRCIERPIKEVNVGLAKRPTTNRSSTWTSAASSWSMVVPPDIMADGLHPTEKGYQIWADTILPTVKNLMK
jgi:lysophospholipase L1-like esterase